MKRLLILTCLALTLVLDTCYGASLPLLESVARRGLELDVVGATTKLPPDGLLYEPELFRWAGGRPGARVSARSGDPLERFRLDSGQLRRAAEQVDGWSGEVLEARLRRRHPNLVLAPLGEGGAEILVPVEPQRFRRQRD